MFKPVRFLVAVGVAVAMVPDGHAAAAVDVSVIRDEALAAAELIEQERTLLDELRAGDVADEATARRQLRTVDEAGVEALRRLRTMGVELSPAIETTLGDIADVGGSDGVELAPGAVVYDAALTDLGRIAATPAAAIPRSDSGTSYDLLFVAAMSLLVLGGTAGANALWRRTDLDETTESAWSDNVTGLASRRRLDHDLDHDTANEPLPTAVILADVDDFASIVERHGTDEADDVLRSVATVLGAYVRTDDVVYRYDRASFCILLRDADDVDAHTVADRIVRAARRVRLPDQSTITVSLGVAPTEGNDVVDALDIADRAVDRARREGSNRAVYADERDSTHV